MNCQLRVTSCDLILKTQVGYKWMSQLITFGVILFFSSVAVRTWKIAVTSWVVKSTTSVMIFLSCSCELVLYTQIGYKWIWPTSWNLNDFCEEMEKLLIELLLL